MTETGTPERLNNGRYEIETELGAGGMARVLLAHDTRLGVYRAIKLLNPALARNAGVRERLKNEAFAQAGLQHPNILMVHDVIEDDDGIYLVMELADYGNLRQKVMTEGPLSPKSAAEAMVSVCGALGVAHKGKVIHRDIKPDNILVAEHGVLKVADFGIARVINRDANLTRTGMVMGTWAYMPPEQRESAHDVDHRADIYALGVTLYYLLSGRNPSSLHNRETHPEAFAHIPPPLTAIVQRATRFNPDERYASCAEMVADLRAVLPLLSDAPLFRLGTDADGPERSGKLIPTDAGLTNRTVIPDPRDMTAAQVEVAATHLPTSAPDTTFSTALTSVIEPIARTHPRTLLFSAVALATFSIAIFGAVMGFLLLPNLVGPATLPPLTDPPTPPLTSSPPPLSPDLPATPEILPATPDDLPVVSTVSSPPEVSPKEASPTPPSPQETRPTAPKEPVASPPVEDGGNKPREIRVISVVNGGGDGGPTEEDGGSADGGLGRAEGRLVLSTVPSGATVRERGRELVSVGGGVYVLSAGSHVLEVTSPRGETTRLPVSVRADGEVTVCYNFDTNSKCNGAP